MLENTTPEDDRLTDLATKAPEAAREARHQAKTYRSVFAGPTLTFDDGTTMDLPPHPDLRMFDEDVLQAYDELLFEVRNSYDHEPDVWIPEQKVSDSTGGEIKLPATLRKGSLIIPLQKTGADGKPELMKPPYEVKLVQLILGERRYRELRSKTIDGQKAGAKDVWRAWNERGEALMQRSDADPKSDAGAVDSPPVPAPDSP